MAAPPAASPPPASGREPLASLAELPAGRAALAVARALAAAGYQSLLAGGCVRDLLLGLTPKDCDVATAATPAEVRALFPRTAAVGEAFGVVIVPGEAPVEVATFRRDRDYPDGRRPAGVDFSTPEEDARRRDFTINGLFLEPATGEILDYVGGRRDLADRLLRAIGDPARRLAEDRLRLLRAVRFAARYALALEPRTAAALRAAAPLAGQVSAERLRDELGRIITDDSRARGVALLDELGFLPFVLPEVAALKGVPQPPQFHPEGDVYTHTLLCLARLERPSRTLALAALLHDAGKPETLERAADRLRFHRHEAAGARIADEAARRLRLPAAERERLVALVQEHMRVAAAPRMRPARLKRFLRAEIFADLLALARADCLASHGRLEAVEFCHEARRRLDAELRPAPLLRGADLLALGGTPGPRFGRILRVIEEHQLSGRLAGREEALALARRLLERHEA